MITSKDWHDLFPNVSATEGCEKGRGNLESSNRLEELPFPAAHSMGTGLQGSGSCTVPIKPHRKCPHELLVPVMNTDARYYLEEKILLQIDFTVEIINKSYYLSYKTFSCPVLLYPCGVNMKDTVKGAVSVKKLYIFIGKLAYLFCRLLYRM